MTRGVSTTALRAELDRIYESPIVLNRGLREAVLAAVKDARPEHERDRDALRARSSATPTAARAARRAGSARRIGMLPEGGKSTPTPWVSSDVLALIARDGLAIAPHEVELG